MKETCLVPLSKICMRQVWNDNERPLMAANGHEWPYITFAPYWYHHLPCTTILPPTLASQLFLDMLGTLSSALGTGVSSLITSCQTVEFGWYPCKKHFGFFWQLLDWQKLQSLQKLHAPSIEWLWPWRTVNDHEWRQMTYTSHYPPTINYHPTPSTSIALFHRDTGNAVLSLWFVLYQWLLLSLILSNSWVWLKSATLWFPVRIGFLWRLVTWQKLSKTAKCTQRLLGRKSTHIYNL